MLAASTMALSLVGLVAAAAFVVVAQRRQRQLGLLTAIGATDRHVSMVMLADGAIIGVVAAVVGTALGVAGWLLAAPAIESVADRRIDRLDLPWGLIVDHRRAGHRDRRGGGVVAGPDGGPPVGDGRPVRPARAAHAPRAARSSPPSSSSASGWPASTSPSRGARTCSRCCSSPGWWRS